MSFFFKRDKSMEHFHSISRFFIVEKRLFRWFRMFFTLRKNDSFCSPKGSLKGPFQNSSSMELLRKLLFRTFIFNSVLSDMSCQLPTNCLNWIDLRSFFIIHTVPRQLYRKVPYEPNRAKADSSKKNIHLLTYLDVNDALQFHL